MSGDLIQSMLDLVALVREFQTVSYSCFVCAEVWQEAATLSCGDTYCSRCISRHWDQEESLQRRYTCPQCRERFKRRPRLCLNSALELDVKRLKQRGSAWFTEGEGFVCAEPGDVSCDVCLRRKCKAVKTCIGCRISFCQSHVLEHEHEEPYKHHKLVEPGINLKEGVCPVHHQCITLYCCTDRHMVCPTCAARQHEGHQVIPIAAEMEQMKEAMVSQMERYKRRLSHFQQEEEKVEEMITDACLAAAKELTIRSLNFIEFINLLKKRQSEVEKEIMARKRSVQKLKMSVEQELLELRRQQAELDSISVTEDTGEFLQKYNRLPELIEQFSSDEEPPAFTDITEVLCDLSDKLQTCPNMGLARTQIKLLQLPTTRGQYLQHAVNIRLDPNTVHRRLVLSQENRRVSVGKREKKYPFHPGRFTAQEMVLSCQELSGSCYFEVKWKELIGFLGLTYKSIGRKGKGGGSILGMNDISWALQFQGNHVHLWHDGEQLEVMNPPFQIASRMGVFLDHTAGYVTFFGVSQEEMFHFAKLQTSFRKPLVVAVKFTGGGDFEFVKLK